MNAEKKCFKCGEVKPLSAFYKHPRMKDGRVNKCKECNKRDVRENRASNVDRYREYDRKRGSRQGYEYTAAYRERFPNKYRAHAMVGRAIRAGNLVRRPCEVCGTDKRIHAHHDDYSMPLNVRWLCSAHHAQWHQENGEGRNA
jgi:hypothetical protein